jgi:tetratricopeptide (TPR) repeat protein
MAKPVAATFVKSLQAALGYWQRRLNEAAPKELDAERHNLYRAVQFGLQHPETRTAAAELATSAFSFVFARGYWQEWLRVMEQAAAVAAELPALSRFWLLTRLGNLRRLNRHLDAALDVHREALVLSQQMGEPLLLAEAHYHLGRALRAVRRYQEAQAQLQAAETLLAQNGGEGAARLAVLTNNALGRVAHDRGQLDEAQIFLERAVAYAREHCDPSLLADQLHDLGNVHRDTGKYEEALAKYEEALSLLEDSGQRLNRILIQRSAGVLHFARQAYSQAEVVFRHIDRPFLHETGNLYQEAIILVSLGNAVLYQERYQEAVQTLADSVAIWRQLEDEVELANAVGSLGEALAGLGQKEDACAAFEEALALLSEYLDNPRARRLWMLFTGEHKKVAGRKEA